MPLQAARKLVLRVAVVAGLVAAVLPLATKTSWTVTVPGTLHAVIPVGGTSGRAASAAPAGGPAPSPGQPAPARAALPFPATHLGFEWHGAEAAPEIRTSADGRQWPGWTHVAVDAVTPGTKTGLRVVAAVHYTLNGSWPTKRVAGRS